MKSMTKELTVRRTRAAMKRTGVSDSTTWELIDNIDAMIGLVNFARDT